MKTFDTVSSKMVFKTAGINQFIFDINQQSLGSSLKTVQYAQYGKAKLTT